MPLPPAQPIAARRIQIATAKGQVPPAMRMLFTLGQGKSRMVADPQGRGFFVVKVNKIIPGNALLQPSLIGQMQSELQQSVVGGLCAPVPRRDPRGHEGQAQRKRDRRR